MAEKEDHREDPMEDHSSRKCSFMIAKRNRRCRMDAAKGSDYCGEHLIHDTSQSTNRRQRVPCPLDSSHTVYEDVLHKHLKKCNVSKKPVPAGYCRAINSGEVGPATSLSLSTCPPDYLQHFIDKVDVAYATHLTCLPEVPEVKVHPSMETALGDPNNGPAALKHLVQQASILGHMEGCGLLGPACRASCYVEFGAGRGKMTACVHRALQTSLIAEMCGMEYVLVDKSSCRRKVDGAHRASQLEGATCHRLLIDIADLDLSGVDVIRGRSLVGVAKHLCGAATDLALRCLLDTLPHQLGRSREQSLSHQHTSGCQALEAAATDGGTQLLGVAMAMCCHHRCTWSALVGQEFLEGCGFSPEEFPLLCQLTSWGVCGVRPPLESGEDRRRWGYVPHPREHVGLKCKRLIDMARVHYLKKRGFLPRLLYYVERETSLENVLLLAVPEVDGSGPTNTHKNVTMATTTSQDLSLS